MLLAPRLRLVALDPKNWQLEALTQTKSKAGLAWKWKFQGYFSTTEGGLKAAVRMGAEVLGRTRKGADITHKPGDIEGIGMMLETIRDLSMRLDTAAEKLMEAQAGATGEPL